MGDYCMNEQRKDFKKDTVSEKPVLLRMENIEKAFPGVKALDKVNLTVKAGTVHALMGENGAGKSTLMKCLFGVYNKDSGNIYLDGKEKNDGSLADMGIIYRQTELKSDGTPDIAAIKAALSATK